MTEGINYSALFADWCGALSQGLAVNTDPTIWEADGCFAALTASLTAEGDTEEIFEDRWDYRRDEHYTVTTGIIARAGCDFGPLKLDCTDDDAPTQEGPWNLLPDDLAEMIAEAMAEVVNEEISRLTPSFDDEPDCDPEPYDYDDRY